MKLSLLVLISMSCLLAAPVSAAAAETVTIWAPDATASPRVDFGIERLTKALEGAGLNHIIIKGPNVPSRAPVIAVGVIGRGESLDGLLPSAMAGSAGPATEGYILAAGPNDVTVVAGHDDSGVLYGCLELAERIRASGKLPGDLDITDAPVFRLRGPCIGMQKTYELPDLGQYNYPYTPELFAFFYDKQQWLEFLDLLVENRMNTLYLWNGHPFSSLVRLADYPEAVEVSRDVFDRNQQMFRFLTTEADKASSM